MMTRVLSPSFKEEEEEIEASKEAILNSLEEKYSKALSSGCRKKRSELLFLRSDENDERRRFHRESGLGAGKKEGTTKEEDEEEEEDVFELDAKALFAPSPLPSSVALLRSDGKVSSSDDEENEENENKKNKKLLLVRKEKIRETNVQLDEDVRNVRDLLERLKTNHYYSSEKATSFSSETTLLGRESSEFFEKQREEDFYEEEVKEESKEESKEEDRSRRRQLLLLQNHLLLPTNAEIAGVNATTQTPRTKKTEDWSVPAEDLVLLSSFRDDDSDDDENNENFVSSNPTAESLRAAGIIF
ncbi:unnamed protein product [Bathycoccus prasinos]|jgi:hypothetical protein